MNNLYIRVVICQALLFFCFISQAQLISTAAGNGSSGYTPDSVIATAVSLDAPWGLAVDAKGIVIYFSDNSNLVRKIDETGRLITVAGNYNKGTGYSGDGGPATDAQLKHPLGLAVDDSGNLYIADGYSHVIRKVNKAGIITTVAGTGVAGFNGDNIPAATAQLNTPWNLFFYKGNLYVADAGNSCIRKIDTAGLISTVAGNHSVGYSGDGGKAIKAKFHTPTDVGFDATGNMYVADLTNFVIRKVDTSGIISTVAGNNKNAGDIYEWDDDNGPAKKAVLSAPTSIAVDAAGNIYISDLFKNVIRFVDAGTGKISTIVGQYKIGNGGYAGDGGNASLAKISSPRAVRLSGNGNMYICDNYYSVIRKVTGGILPLTLLNFSINTKNASNLLSWQTANEVNTSYFNVERSADSHQFNAVGKVDAASINKFTQSYLYVDRQPLSGINYYRLKVVDKDGIYTYSAIKTVVNSATAFSAILYPNPVRNSASIEFKSNKIQQVTIEIVDINGKVEISSQQLIEGTVTKNIDTRRLTAGIYIIKIKSEGHEQAGLKFIKH